ncbi:MAG: class I SAM-dependent RNA methyltransferase [Alphaproteobacteria bacterium]|nr:class I SAM-dependent RNA methyltransferase [Alphaproteobacteria bacterium]
MSCPVAQQCGGCPHRSKDIEAYREYKISKVTKALSSLPQPLPWSKPIFIADGTRRRTSMAFKYHKGTLSLGFNPKAKHEIVDVFSCQLLTPLINSVLPMVRKMILDLCSCPYTTKKGKKQISQRIVTGDVWISEVSGGLDIVLEYDAPLTLEHRMIMFEHITAEPSVIRLSHRHNSSVRSEPIIEKTPPTVSIGEFNVSIPAGTFMQPSKEGECALTDIVASYIGQTYSNIADLFCGVGTFSYVISKLTTGKILAIDSSEELLRGFRVSVNQNQINNIEIQSRNLFKYPLDSADLKNVDIVVFDPPRAGAAAQCKLLASMPPDRRPSKIIAISCNPNTFVNDAQQLISGGYILKDIRLVDQFVYSEHSELVALFTNQ